MRETASASLETRATALLCMFPRDNTIKQHRVSHDFSDNLGKSGSRCDGSSVLVVNWKKKLLFVENILPSGNENKKFNIYRRGKENVVKNFQVNFKIKCIELKQM